MTTIPNRPEAGKNMTIEMECPTCGTLCVSSGEDDWTPVELAASPAAPSPAQTERGAFTDAEISAFEGLDVTQAKFYFDRRNADGRTHRQMASDLLAARAALQAAPAAENERLETMSENIARDIREGRFPQRSEPQTIGTAPQQAADTTEGCAVADAKMLREANHALAAENELLRKRLRPFAHLVGSGEMSWAMVEYCVKDDPEKQTFQAPQMQRAFNRAAEAYRNAAPQPAADAPGMAEPVAWIFDDGTPREQWTHIGNLHFDGPNEVQLELAEKYGWKWIPLYAAPQPVAQTERAQPVEQTRAMTGWQPIETAPMDGTVLILFARAKHATASAPVFGWWLPDLGWIESAYSPNHPVGIVPSHWMTRPEFPAAAQPASGEK